MLEVIDPHPDCEVCKRSHERWEHLNVQLRVAKNGFIVVHRGDEFVFKTSELAGKFMQEILDGAL